jgi:hypothetical protein
MLTGWLDILMQPLRRGKMEFVSVDARRDVLKKDTRSYEMLSRDCGKTMDDLVTPSAETPIPPLSKLHARSSSSERADEENGRRTPDYFGQAFRYQIPARSFSSPKPPNRVTWDAMPAQYPETDNDVHPLGMNQV